MARGPIAFLIDIEDSYGERELACQFAARLADPRDAVFVVTERAAPHVRDRFTTRAYRELGEAVALLRELEPSVVVCVEYFNLPDELQAAVAAGPWQLATTDGTGLGYAINTNPFHAATPRRTMSVPDRLIHLASCPMHDPAPDDERTFHWATWSELTRGDGAAVRRAWDVRGDRLAMMAISAWSPVAAGPARGRAHYPTLYARVVDALQASGVAAELMVVAPQARPRYQAGRVSVRFIEYQPASVFEQLVLGCDLFVADSVIQMSAGKALIAGIPTVVLVNGRPEHGPVYDIFPLALRFPAGAYRAALAPVEISDVAAIRARVSAALAGESPPAADDYRAALAGLRSPADIAALL